MKRNTDKAKTNGEPYYMGIEIGAVSVKWVRITQDGKTSSNIRRHEGNPKKTILQIIDHYQNEKNSRIVITGQTAQALLDLPYRSELECIERALAFHDVKPDIILSLGGETFSIYPMKNGQIKNVISTSKCAAGTGEFMVQQFQRMGLSLEEGIDASKDGNIVPLATRCSVHCKSDATHKLNKGECNTGDIARSLINDLAKKVQSMVEISKWPRQSILVSGGVASNGPFVETLKSLFNDSKLTVLPESHYLEAFGAALCASSLSENIPIAPQNKWFKTSKPAFESIEALSIAESLLDYRVQTNGHQTIEEGESYILGVDAGSTTTKAVLLNVSSSEVCARSYLRTLGNPVQGTINCLKELIEQIGHRSVKIIQIGVTGSGREMVSIYLNNCQSFNEILAHGRAASEALPQVDTVFEIGGQDSKYISFIEGIPVDYAMNEGCSAGTGSFIEESASIDMGVSMTDISDIAESSNHPIAFGERCAAFINTDLRNALQQGAGQQDVIAGLAYSVADNYISRVVGTRFIGENLLFQGGLALNRAVALAMAIRTGRNIVVPPHPELMGCVGTALMIRDLIADDDLDEEIQELELLIDGGMNTGETFRCKSCDNLCEIQKIGIRGKSYPFGGLCAKYELLRHKKDQIKEGRDLIAVKNKMMFDTFGPRSIEYPRGTIGLPMALTAFELFPFYANLINELGYNVVLSKPSKLKNTRTSAAICYPCEIVHQAVSDLLTQDVDFIFLPHVIELEKNAECLHSYTCPSTTIIPDIISAAFKKDADKILSPHIGLSFHLLQTTLNEIADIGPSLGLEKEAARLAGEKALAHYRKFRQAYQEQGQIELENLGDAPAVIIAGRPYITCAAEVNLALPRKIASRGYHVIPSDMLPQISPFPHPRDVWYFTQQISNAVAWVNKKSNLYICLVSCFSCGPDSSMYNFFRQNLTGRTFCYLEIDSHTAQAGIETRVGAFIDIIEKRKRKGEKENPQKQKTIYDTVEDTKVRPARLSENLDCIIDSNGDRVEYTNSRVTHVWAFDASPFARQIIARIYDKNGRNFRSTRQTDPEILQQARKFCSGRECLPMTAMVGAVLTDIQHNRQENEITIYFTPDQEGPCQNGAWPVIWQTVGNRLNIKNAIFGIRPHKDNNYLGGLESNTSLILGDFFEEAKNTLICLARQKDKALQIFKSAFDCFVESFIMESNDIESALDAWVVHISGIPLKATVAETPKILIIGGVNLQWIHRPVTDFFLNQGILPKVVPYSEGLCWVASENNVRYGFKHSITTPDEQFSYSPKGANGKEAVKARQSRFSLHLIDSLESKLRRTMQKSGLMFDRHIPFIDIAKAGHRVASYNGFTETSVTAGRYICAMEGNVFDGLINLGTFNCQPAMNSQAVIRPLANASDTPYVAMDCEGPWISANQRRLLETLSVQAKRVRREKNLI